MPSAMPRSVGRATNQPTRPSIPRPNQMLRGLPRCAVSLRFSFLSTWRLKDARSVPDLTLCASSMLELQETPCESALQPGEHRTETPFSLIKIQKLPLDSFAKLSQACTADCVADRDDNFRTGFHQHARVDGHVYRAFGGCLVGQDSWSKRRCAIQPPRQQAEGAGGRLGYYAQDVFFPGKDLEWEQDFQTHRLRFHR